MSEEHDIDPRQLALRLLAGMLGNNYDTAAQTVKELRPDTAYLWRMVKELTAFSTALSVTIVAMKGLPEIALLDMPILIEEALSECERIAEREMP